MQLKKPGSASELIMGKLVVMFSVTDGCYLANLRLIDFLDDCQVKLVPLSLLFDDDAICDELSISEALDLLKFPLFEVNDLVLFHGRLASIVSCVENDYHLQIAMREAPDQAIYTNLVHLDFSICISFFNVNKQCA